LAHFFGYDVNDDDLRHFRQPHSRTPGHPEVGVTPTVEVTEQAPWVRVSPMVSVWPSPSEFSGRSSAPGRVSHRTWVVAGDGCLQEGISHEAASLAGRWGHRRSDRYLRR
jgi:transketolase